MTVHLRLDGERALFARPEFRHDLISYDLITPHAARGVLDAIYRRPGMNWVIDAIHILHPIRRECIEEAGRRIVILRDVGYLIDAHFELTDGAPAESTGRHAAMFKRAMRVPTAAYLGRAGYTAIAALTDPHMSIAAAPVTTDYGWLMHGIDFAGDRRPRYFRAEAVGGRVCVPSDDSPLLFG